MAVSRQSTSGNVTVNNHLGDHLKEIDNKGIKHQEKKEEKEKERKEEKPVDRGVLKTSDEFSCVRPSCACAWISCDIWDTQTAARRRTRI